MMTQVDFHTHIEDRLHYTCKLVRRAFEAQDNPLLSRLIILAEGVLLSQIDQHLWTFSALDFLPHVALDHPLQANTPILLARHFDKIPDNASILINLTPTLPPCFTHFKRLLEIVSSDTQALAAARERYRIYKEQGFVLKNYGRSE